MAIILLKIGELFFELLLKIDNDWLSILTKPVLCTKRPYQLRYDYECNDTNNGTIILTMARSKGQRC